MQNEIEIKALRQICQDLGLKGTSFSDANANNKNMALFSLLALKITPAQIVTLVKAAKFGWHLTRLYWNDNSCAIVLATTTNVGIVYPDGSLDRAPHNKNRVSLNQAKWKASEQDQSQEV